MNTKNKIIAMMVAIIMVVTFVGCAVDESVKCSASEIAEDETFVEETTEIAEEVIEEQSENMVEENSETAVEEMTEEFDEIPIEKDSENTIENNVEELIEESVDKVSDVIIEEYNMVVEEPIENNMETTTENTVAETVAGYDPDMDMGIGMYNPYMYCPVQPTTNCKFGFGYIDEGYYLFDEDGHCWGINNPDLHSGEVGIVYDTMGTDKIEDDVLLLITVNWPVKITDHFWAK